MTDERDKILAEYAAKDVDTLDRERDVLHLEQLEVLKEYAKARDTELTMKFEKRNALLAGGGNSYSKVESLLRADSELYIAKKLILALSTKKKEIEIRLEIVSGFFWKNR